MFIGHFGIAFAAKALARKTSLGTLFIAAQFLDLIWPTLLWLGIEHFDKPSVPDAYALSMFDNYPVSHGLAAVVIWALLLGGVYWLFRRDKMGSAVVCALVLSHWLLDMVVRRPDLPIYPGSSTLMGLEEWNSWPVMLMIETAIFALGVGSYFNVAVAKDQFGRWGLWGLMAVLVGIYVACLLGAAVLSEDKNIIVLVGQSQWLLIAWAYWVDKHRSVVSDNV